MLGVVLASSPNLQEPIGPVTHLASEGTASLTIPIALEVDGVSKSFGSINALEGVSLKLAAGRVTALVGDNGAGKSTLVKIMSGVFMPNAGSVRVDGRQVD